MTANADDEKLTQLIDKHKTYCWSDEWQLYWVKKRDKSLVELQSGAYLEKSERELIIKGLADIAVGLELLEKHDRTCGGCRLH
jgi:hypothetical protein